MSLRERLRRLEDPAYVTWLVESGFRPEPALYETPMCVQRTQHLPVLNPSDPRRTPRYLTEDVREVGQEREEA